MKMVRLKEGTKPYLLKSRINRERRVQRFASKESLAVIVNQIILNNNFNYLCVTVNRYRYGRLKNDGKEEIIEVRERCEDSQG
jgi:hypothetical protein